MTPHLLNISLRLIIIGGGCRRPGREWGQAGRYAHLALVSGGAGPRLGGAGPRRPAEMTKSARRSAASVVRAQALVRAGTVAWRRHQAQPSEPEPSALPRGVGTQ